MYYTTIKKKQKNCICPQNCFPFVLSPFLLNGSLQNGASFFAQLVIGNSHNTTQLAIVIIIHGCGEGLWS